MCAGAKGTIGEESCRAGSPTGSETCVDLDGDVGESSCFGELACKELKGKLYSPRVVDNQE